MYFLFGLEVSIRVALQVVTEHKIPDDFVTVMVAINKTDIRYEQLREHCRRVQKMWTDGSPEREWK